MKLAGQIAMGFDALLGMLGRRRPVNVMASVTDRCPSRCAYCRIPERNRPDLSTNQWKRLFDEMAAAGTRRIGIWGGEPLVRDDIVEICRHARSLGIYVSLDSNGYLLPDRLEILDAIDHLVLAYDGPREAHDANRQPGSHDRVVAAMESASGRVRLWTITVLTRNNIDAVDDILETAKEYGFLATFQTLHHNEELGRNPEGMMPSSSEYSRVFARLAELRRGGAPIANSTRYLESLAKWPDHRRTTSPGKFHGVPCRAGSMYCNIDVDGTVFPCSLLIGLYPGALNALEVGFRKAFEAASSLPCQACVAGCYTEYNFLYNLDVGTAFQWFGSVRATDRAMREAAARRGL
ncbi:radical SAM protein [Candidatus Fermentibacteria bacterium]|nr:radical SAM protein [Candidatus Fermentibacteria bacterium]